MLKLDIDDYAEVSRLTLLRLFFSLPFPYSVRFSSSGKGLHIKCDALDVDDYRRGMYDDRVRVMLDDHRRAWGSPIYNLLWNEKEGKKAGKWRVMRCSADVVAFIDLISVEK